MTKVYHVTVHYVFDGLLHFDDVALADRVDVYHVKFPDVEACLRWVVNLYQEGRLTITSVTIKEGPYNGT